MAIARVSLTVSAAAALLISSWALVAVGALQGSMDGGPEDHDPVALLDDALWAVGHPEEVLAAGGDPSEAAAAANELQAWLAEHSVTLPEDVHQRLRGHDHLRPLVANPRVRSGLNASDLPWAAELARKKGNLTTGGGGSARLLGDLPGYDGLDHDTAQPGEVRQVRRLSFLASGMGPGGYGRGMVEGVCRAGDYFVSSRPLDYPLVMSRRRARRARAAVQSVRRLRSQRLTAEDAAHYNQRRLEVAGPAAPLVTESQKGNSSSGFYSSSAAFSNFDDDGGRVPYWERNVPLVSLKTAADREGVNGGLSHTHPGARPPITLDLTRFLLETEKEEAASRGRDGGGGDSRVSSPGASRARRLT